jgi:peptidoglycan/LPS O-acetylase OafA/YrhL
VTGSEVGDGGRRERIPALDGLRGVAVLAVLAFHAQVGGLPGGFLGVDVFFVLSGFLITDLLLRRPTGAGTLSDFLARRARRLVPAMLVVVGATVVVAVVLSDRVAGLRADALAAVAGLSNWRFLAASQGYEAQTADPSPLQHLWSLSVEQQLYLVWGVVVVAAVAGSGRARRSAAGVVLVLAACGAAASAALMAGLSLAAADPWRLHYGTDTRGHVLLVGAALAAALERHRQRGPAPPAPPEAGKSAAGMAAAGGAVVLVLLATQVEVGTPSVARGATTLAAVATAAVIAGAVLDPGGVVGRVLASRPLRLVGAISFALYLWHWPVQLTLTGARTGLDGWALVGVRWAVAAVLATASTVLVEHPVLRWQRPPAPTLLALAMASALIAGVVVVATRDATASDVAASAVSGPPSREHDPRPASSTAATTPGGPAPTDGVDPVAGPSSTTTAPATSIPASPATPASPPTEVQARPLRVLVLGDSVAQSLAEVVGPATTLDRVSVVDGSTRGCGVATSGDYRMSGTHGGLAALCVAWPDRWRQALDGTSADVVVVLVGRHEVLDRQLDGTWSHIGEPRYDAYLRGQLHQALDLAAGGGAPVAVLTAPYFRRPESPSGAPWPEDDPARIDAFNVLLRSVVAESGPQVHLLDLGARLAPDGIYTATVDGVAVRSDGVHLAPTSGRLLASWLVPEVRRLAG